MTAIIGENIIHYDGKILDLSLNCTYLVFNNIEQTLKYFDDVLIKKNDELKELSNKGLLGYLFEYKDIDIKINNIKNYIIKINRDIDQVNYIKSYISKNHTHDNFHNDNFDLKEVLNKRYQS